MFIKPLKIAVFVFRVFTLPGYFPLKNCISSKNVLNFLVKHDLLF